MSFNRIPDDATDRLMLVSKSRVSTEQKAQFEDLGITTKEAPMPGAMLIQFPFGWTVIQKGLPGGKKRASKGDVEFEF